MGMGVSENLGILCLAGFRTAPDRAVASLRQVMGWRPFRPVTIFSDVNLSGRGRATSGARWHWYWDRRASLAGLPLANLMSVLAFTSFIPENLPAWRGRRMIRPTQDGRRCPGASVLAHSFLHNQFLAATEYRILRSLHLSGLLNTFAGG